MRLFARRHFIAFFTATIKIQALLKYIACAAAHFFRDTTIHILLVGLALAGSPIIKTHSVNHCTIHDVTSN